MVEGQSLFSWHMKQIIFSGFLGAVLLSAASVYGQTGVAPRADSKLYVRIGAGYGFTHAGQTSILNSPDGPGLYFNGSSATVSGVAGTFESYNTKRGSFGTGGALVVAGGYMIMRHIGIELGVEATVLPRQYEFSAVETGNNDATIKYTTKANLPVYLMPAVMMTTGGKGLNLYGRVGLAIPVADKMKIKLDLTDNGSGGQYALAYDFTQRFSIGFQGAAGLSYPAGRNMRVWAEADGLFRNAYAKKLEVTSAVQNGINVLPSFSRHDQVTEFDFDVTNGPGVGNATSPQKALTSASPYSYIGGKVGVSFDF